jgi:hypothetical protein
MAHQVFVSYSSRDQAAAQAICAALETAGIRCWIAPRDIEAASQWGGSIVGAVATRLSCRDKALCGHHSSLPVTVPR